MPKNSSADGPTAPLPGVGERILSTASELFYQEGVRAVGIQRVIDEAGIARASLYAHYASKDDLVAACIDRRARAGREMVEARLADPSLDARGRLLRLFDVQMEWIHAADFRGCPLLNAQSEIADASHPAHAVTRTYRDWLHTLLTTLATEAGAARPDALAGTLLVLYDGASASAMLDQSPASARHAREAAELLLDAHTAKRSRP